MMELSQPGPRRVYCVQDTYPKWSNTTQNTDNVLEDICSIIESARNYAYQSVNIALVERN